MSALHVANVEAFYCNGGFAAHWRWRMKQLVRLMPPLPQGTNYSIRGPAALS
jgi:hypothetical protein